MNTIRILLAEDNADHQELLSHLITSGRPQINLTIASSLPEVVREVEQHDFDCIVLDYNLPPHIAPETLEAIENLQPDVPRLVTSSSEEQQIVVDALRHGVADFVNKQEAIHGDMLWKRIQDAIARAEEQRKERRETQRRLATLWKESSTDALTGLANRRLFEKVLRKCAERGDRRELSALILLDLDHFKHVNDTLGHEAGDRVLRAAADIIHARCGGGDIAARWGGEEFIVLSQSKSLTEAWVWADNLRQAIATQVCVEDPIRRVTASIGIDVMPTNSLCGHSFMRPDRAMYLAKESGRNRVMTYDMVRAMEAAEETASEPGMSLNDRLDALICAMSDSLGAVQCDQVGEHCRRVRELTREIACMLNISRETTSALLLAAQYHDIGKLGIPEDLLAKPAALTDGERRFVAEHARFGAQLASVCGATEEVTDLIASHHDRFDDTVGEQGAAETSMPAPNLVLSACDAFVAMTSERPYSEAWSDQRAKEELRSERGRQFDPSTVDALQHANTLARAA